MRDVTEFIDTKVQEIKYHESEYKQMVTALIHILLIQNAKSNNLTKWLKQLSGGSKLKLVDKDDIDDVHRFAMEFLEVIVKESDEKNIASIINELKNNQIDENYIERIEALQIKKENKGRIIFYALNSLSILISFILYYLGYYKNEFIPIITQLVVIIISLTLNRQYQIKSGLILSVINFLFLYDTKVMVTEYSYQLIFFLFVLYLVLGQIVALLPQMINQFIQGRFTQIKPIIALYLSALISSSLFMIIYVWGNIQYTDKLNLVYTYQPLYKIGQIILIGAIAVEVSDMILKNEL